MVPFTPAKKDNMIAWLAARCDEPNYGKLLVFDFPKQNLVYGPQQIESRINQDPEISKALTLWNQGGSRVIRGSLLVIPVEQSLIYVQPLYIAAQNGGVPELKRVIVAYGNSIAMEETLEKSLSVIFGGTSLPQSAVSTAAAMPAAPQTNDVKGLIAQALERRPDLRAARAARGQGEAALGAAQREAYPDISLGAGYTHSDFTVSGDNPNTLALSLSMPLPLFDRNQANIGRARLDIRRAENDVERLRLQIGHEVIEAVRKAQRSQTLLEVFEGAPAENRERSSGMVAKAETALHVAEKSYQAGALSLLELLEAQRTYLDSKAQYLRVLYDFRQAAVDVTYAAGE